MLTETMIIGGVASFIIENGSSFLIDKGLGKFIDKFAPNPVDKAYNQALKRWCRNSEIREKYAIFKYSHFEEFREYLQKGPEVCNTELLSLCKLFDEELKKDSKTYQFIQDIYNESNLQRQKDIQNVLEEVRLDVKQLSEHNEKQHIEQTEWLKKILYSIENRRVLEATPAEAYNYDKDTYISRKCCLTLEGSSSFDKYLHPEKYPEGCLVDFVLGKYNVGSNKILLCGAAQSGKTTELRHLFHELVDSSLFRIFYKEIKGWDFTLSSISLSESEQRETLVIIDALDEKFDDNKRNDLFNSINNFANSHPFLRMVVSCRSNFKEISQLENFVHLELLDFEWEDSKMIIREKCNNSERLIAEIESKSLYGLAKNPLFLLTLIEYYQQSNTILSSRSQIYEYLIDKRLKDEEQKHLISHPKMSSKGKTALESMAVGLQLMDKNFFSEEELLDLFEDELQWDRILRSGIIVKRGDGYEFEHNSFKEYFVAGFLRRLNNLEEIQSLCCFYGVKLIKPTWYNVFVSYLSSLSSNVPLFSAIIEWMEKDNEELLCYVEPQLVDEDKRCKIFIGIIEECKRKGIIYGVRNHGLPEALMRFGYGLKSVNYITSELQKAVVYDTHFSNLLRCLQYLDWKSMEERGYLRETQLQDLLFDLFGRFGNDYKAWAIWDPFEHLFFHNTQSFDKLLNIIIQSKHPKIWDSFIRLVYKAGLVEEYIDIIIEKSEFVHNFDDDGVTCAIFPVWINESFKSVSTKEGVLKILKYFEKGVSNRESKSEFISKHKGVIETLISKGEKLIPQAELTTVLKQLFESGIDPISPYADIRDFNKPIVDYLTQQGLAESLFDEYTKKIVSGIEKKDNNLSPHKYAKCASCFVTAEWFELFASEHANSEVGFWSVRCLNSYMSGCDVQYNQIMKEYYQTYFVDVNAQIKNHQTDYLNCLFDYESFKKEVLKLLNEHPDDRKALNKRLNEYDDIEDKLNIYVYYFFNEFIENNKYDFERIKESIEDVDIYHRFLLKETLNNLSPDNDNDLSDNQTQRLIQIAKEFIQRFVNEDEKMTIGFLYYPIEMILKGYVDIDNSDLLKLLPYSTYYIYDNNRMNYYSLFEFISTRSGIDKRVIMDFIVSEVESRKPVSEFAQTKWAKFIINNSIENGFQYVIEWAKKDDYVLSMLVDNHKTLQIITRDKVLDQFPNRAKLNLFEMLIRKESYDASWVKERLESVFDSLTDESERFLAMKILLIQGSMKGLEYINKHPEYYSKNGIILNYDCDESLPLLFDSLDWLMEKRNGKEGAILYETKSSVISSIGKIAAHSQTLFDDVEHRINELVSTNKTKYSELNYYLSEWKENLYKKTTQTWTIESVREVLSTYKLVG